ncbi:transcriptional regulator [Devosia pacifica]|uniref:Transcriptional regulator n=1 Tax=Devosia pacifica TaxID=1335967 RepID=A0A918SCU1_9HYPH|nr:LysR family transcriptional regulator [Devosia pacifica]GHA32669.1 transcriptional regulator [Devosia pacifica]
MSENSPMELRQLEYFIAAAKAEHFTRAARRLNIVQSALSSAIRSLEEELGTPLFVRTTRQVRLTAAGRTLLEKAEAVTEAVREAREAVTAIAEARAGKLSLGTVQGLPAFLDLPALLASFHERHPQVEVRLIQAGSAHLLEKLRAGKLDLAFLPVFEPPSDIATTIIACEELVVVCAPEHPLAHRQSVPPRDLATAPFVEFESDWGTRRLADEAFASAGIDRHIAFEVSDLSTMLELVTRGLGIALVPESVAANRANDLAQCRLAGPEACWELVVATRTSARQEALVGRFLDLLGGIRDNHELEQDEARVAS